MRRRIAPEATVRPPTTAEDAQMTDLSPRPDRTPRRTREDRAYKLVLAGGAAAAIAVVTFVLAIVGVMGFGIPVLAALVSALCAWLFRRTVS
jgi:hypothetical protein